ncbi:MAG: archaeosortase A [Thermoplasmatota archaeon]
MDKKNIFYNENSFSFLFLVIPIVMLLISYLVYPYPPSDFTLKLIQIPIFLGLIILGAGFFIKNDALASKLKIIGWMIFAFYWSTQPKPLYLNENGDVFNASVCIIGVFILFYFAYHEWLSILRKEKIGCLNWIAGATAIAGLIYFGIELSFLKDWLIQVTAQQSGLVLDFVIGNVKVVGDSIYHNNTYVVTIIFACTAIQSMVVFVGMIAAISKVGVNEKIFGLLITVVPIYFLNLLRNALVGFLLAKDLTDLNMAHNVIAKIGSLIAMIILLFIVIKIIPEIFNEITCLTELYKRNGPLEKGFKKIFKRKKID